MRSGLFTRVRFGFPSLLIVTTFMCCVTGCLGQAEQSDGDGVEAKDRYVYHTDMTRADASVDMPDTSQLDMMEEVISDMPGGDTDLPDAEQPTDMMLEDMSDSMEPYPAGCDLKLPQFEGTGQIHAFSPDSDLSLQEVIAQASGGDTIVLSEGQYPATSLEATFETPVMIMAEEGASVHVQGLSCLRCKNLIFKDIQFLIDDAEGSPGNTVNLDASESITFQHVQMSAPAGKSVLRIYGQRNGANSNIKIYDSEIRGGQRTVFILGRFAPSEEWNSGLEFVRNHIECGTATCMQVSGGRDILLADNTFESAKGVGLLTAGATRLHIERNQFTGHTDAGVGMNLATPGRQWDNFAGVQHMVSSDLHIVNNIFSGWKNAAIALNAVIDVDIAHNTMVNGGGISTNHRTPQKYMSDEVILEGNQDYRVWHNILPRMNIHAEDPRPVVEAFNIVVGSGGGGEGLIQADPILGGEPYYAPMEGSPAIDAAMWVSENDDMNILLDYWGLPREEVRDIGAIEFGNMMQECPE